MKRICLVISGLCFVTVVMATASCTVVTTGKSADNPLRQKTSSLSVVGDSAAKHQGLVSDMGTRGLLGAESENPALAIFHPMATHTAKTPLNENFSGSALNNLSPEQYARSDVEIDGIVTSLDVTSGTLEVEGIEIKLSDTTGYSDGDQYIDREAFFAKLRQGVSVVIVKWRSFTSYGQSPHTIELES
ncbi:MAG: hypothetical protein AB8B64_07560 [Granulosicoccus sp.]